MNDYPANWKEIAVRIKLAAEWHCERCQHPHDVASGHVLTVHHLDGDKANCADWNLAALCQRCHLKIQGRVKMDQMFFFGGVAIVELVHAALRRVFAEQGKRLTVTELVLSLFPGIGLLDRGFEQAGF